MIDLLTGSLEAFSAILLQWPWLLLGLVAMPLVWLAWRKQVYPSVWWSIPLVASLMLSVLTVWVPSLLLLTAIVDFTLLLVVSTDLLYLLATSGRNIEVERSIPRTGSLGVPVDSELTIENRTGMSLHGRFRDDTPEDFRSDPPQHRLHLPRLGRVTARRKLTPGRRGAFELESVYLRFFSPFRFWVRQRTFELKDRLNVYPDMKQLSDYALLARTNRLSLIGVRRTRRVGQDSDFERLRDYTRDDNYRHIDWRSTARRNRLTVRQFQSDQSQRVLFLLDCGRMMTNERDGYTLLDHALNSMLMMAYVALHQGDSVGMLCFSDRIHSYIPPRGGASQMNRLIQAGFDRFPQLVESRYDQAFLHLDTHCKKRSLVVLMTNLIDEVNAATLVDHLGNVGGRHLPLGVLLRDRVMWEAAEGFDPETPPEHPMEAKKSMYRAAVASDILLWRDQVITDLHHRGVLVVDEYPDELTAPLVNEYLNVKAKHLL